MHVSLFGGSRRGSWVAWAGILAAIAVVSPVHAQSRTLPAGSVIIVRTTAPLQSATAQTGQTFETTVEENVSLDEFSVIPAGSRVRGTITLAQPATRRQSGVIEVVFDRLMLADGSTYAIAGKLTSTDSAERRQINADPNARVVLVGGRGGIGAAIAGAGSGRTTNNVLSALGVMLSEGRDVNVPAGTLLAVEIERAVSLRARGRMRDEGSAIFTAAERVRAAQQALQRLNYYRGAVNGMLDDPTRRALFEFQVDRGLRATGNLDGRTARALGLQLTGGLSGNVMSADDASAVRRDAQSIVARLRAELGISTVGRLDDARVYAQTDIDLWFALSSFADNASLYEQVVRNGSNRDAAVLAGRALVAAARRVDNATQSVQISRQLRNAWAIVRQRLSSIDTSG
jgi:peptidoglycan hydrolase-like protein with peptidoglycan-binding domain